MSEPGAGAGSGQPAAGPWGGAFAAIEAWGANTAGEDRPTDGSEPARPRSVADGGVVELREVTSDTVRAVCRLAVGPGQRGFVAPNAVSLAEAMFSPLAWFRAITADGVPVGFAMLEADPEGTDNDGVPSYYLWRLMVAEGLQGCGFGWRAMELIIEHVRTLPGARELVTSWVPGEGSPEGFYLGLGFEPTGEIAGHEVVGRLVL